jgi:hypothetical protein
MRSMVSRVVLCAGVAMAVGLCVSPAMAVDELLLKNDNIAAADPDFPVTAPVGLQFNFDADEKVGVVLLIPPEYRPAKVLRVQVMWRSASGNTGNTIHDNLEIWKGRVGLPAFVPAASKIFDSLDAPPDGFSPQLVDGFVNEYDLSQFNIIIPAEYDRFTFAMTFASNTTAPAGATTPIDLNGITPARNWVFGTIPPFINTAQWFDMSLFQTTGDVIMRAVITKAPPPPPARCGPADIANDQGEPIVNPATPPNPLAPNNGVTEGDYNAFFSGFFDALAWCDIADDQGTPLAPFGTGATGGVPNNGVTEGDYNLFFSVYFNGC